jgi:hypothetical protein
VSLFYKGLPLTISISPNTPSTIPSTDIPQVRQGFEKFHFLEGLPEKASNHFQLILNKSISLIRETDVRQTLLSGCLTYKAFKLSFFGQSQPAEYRHQL